MTVYYAQGANRMLTYIHVSLVTSLVACAVVLLPYYDKSDVAVRIMMSLQMSVDAIMSKVVIKGFQP